MDEKNTKTKGPLVLLIYLALALAIVAVYWQVRHYEFLNFDDNYYIYENPYVRTGLTRENIIWAFSLKEGIEQTGTWHPLTWLSHILDCEIYGLQAGGHHLTSVLFHIVNSLLVLSVFRRMTGRLWSSVFVAAVFALHPLRVESVAWVATRKDVLSTMFWLLTMMAYTGYARRPNAGRYILTLITYVLGLLSKQMLVTLPFVLLLLDYWPLGRFHFGNSAEENNPAATSPSSRPQLSVIRRLVAEKIPFFVLSAVACVIIYIAQQFGGSVAAEGDLPLNLRIFNALLSYVKYLEKFIYPVRLCAFYSFQSDSLSLFQAIVCLSILILISAAVICLARRRYLVVGWLWYLGTLVPVIGIVQIGSQAMADRYTYVPHIGLSIMAAWGIPDLLGRLRYRRVILASASIVVILVLSVMSWHQVRTWRNSIVLFKHAINTTPDNWYAHRLLAYTLQNNKQYDEAIEHYKEVLRLIPGSADEQNNIGYILIQQGRLDEAIELYQQLLPPIPDTAEDPGIRPAKYGKLATIVRIYTEGHVNFGIALEQKGLTDEAARHYAEALRIRPDFEAARTRLNNILKLQKNPD